MLAPKLIVLTDTTLVPVSELIARAHDLCASCSPQSVMLQLRDRELGIRERLVLGEQLSRLAQDCDQYLCVNDRVDLAMLLDAHALHLGERSVRAHDIRQRLGDRFWLTSALHDPSNAGSQGTDAFILSPICATRKGAPALGLGAIHAACAGTSLPVYALGGVNAGNAADCLNAGATGIAAIGAWLASGSVKPLVEALGIARSA